MLRGKEKADLQPPKESKNKKAVFVVTCICMYRLCKFKLKSNISLTLKVSQVAYFFFLPDGE